MKCSVQREGGRSQGGRGGGGGRQGGRGGKKEGGKKVNPLERIYIIFLLFNVLMLYFYR